MTECFKYIDGLPFVIAEAIRERLKNITIIAEQKAGVVGSTLNGLNGEI